MYMFIENKEDLMGNEPVPQPQQLFQSLKNSMWIFSALAILTESDGLVALKKKMSIDDLGKIIGVPKSILTQALHLLMEVGCVVSENNQYCLSVAMQDFIESEGIREFTAQLQAAFGKTQHLVLAARDKRLNMAWEYQDPVILQAQGVLSEVVATDFISPDSDIAQILMQPGAHCMDVGAGVARISLKLCELYPALFATAFEPSTIPFQLAEQNVATSPYKNRINLRQQSIQEITDQHLFDVAWVAQRFIMDEHLIPGLTAIHSALKPGGQIIVSTFFTAHKNIASCVKNFSDSLYAELRSIPEITTLLHNAGFIEIKVSTDVLAGCKVITAIAA